jgi:UDP-3-O-[3-hydroxymyristoyl] glucosamine N-acyltransferase
VEVWKPARIEEGEEGSISFLSNPKYTDYAYTSKSSVLLVGREFIQEKPISATLIRVENVPLAVSFLMEKFQEQSAKAPSIIDKQASLATDVVTGENVSVGAFSYIGAGTKIGKNSRIYPQVFIDENVEIGENVTLYAGVKIFKDCKIGNNAVIHAGTVIGSDGFGFAPQADGTYKKIPQLGNVVIGNDVEIGANTVIDRAVMGSTVIADGVKLDNLIQVAHNVYIGENTVIAAQAGIAGSTKLGKNCMIGGQAGFVGHIQIADKVKVQAQSGVASSIPEEGKAVYGSPALPYKDYLRAYALFKNFPDLEKRLRALEK